MMDTELATTPRPERKSNALPNIQELESDITSYSGKVTAEDRELITVLKRAGINKDGVLSLNGTVRDDAKVRAPSCESLTLSLTCADIRGPPY